MLPALIHHLAGPFKWLGRQERGTLIALAAIACGVLLFAWIAGEVAGGATDSFDRSIVLSMRGPAGEQHPALRSARATLPR